MERVFALLHILTERADKGFRLPEIADRLKFHRVNIHRMVKSLMDLGYVEQAPDLSYHLGFETWRLGQIATQASPAFRRRQRYLLARYDGEQFRLLGVYKKPSLLLVGWFRPSLPASALCWVR
jgi:DNA-binding IclR family transcriptional regulator